MADLEEKLKWLASLDPAARIEHLEAVMESELTPADVNALAEMIHRLGGGRQDLVAYLQSLGHERARRLQKILAAVESSFEK